MKDCNVTEVFYGTQKSNPYYRVPKNISLLMMHVSIKICKDLIEVEKQRWLEYIRSEVDLDVISLYKYKVEYEDDHFLMLEFSQEKETLDDEGCPIHIRYKLRSAVIKVQNWNKDGMTPIDLVITDELKHKLIEWQE